jgi:large subunit ribosomal protein L5
MIQRLKTYYSETVTPLLVKKLEYKNCHQIPKIEKIQVNRCLGLAAQNTNILKKSIEEFTAITGQKPIITKSKKAIAGFKIREDMNLGITVTLRNEKMYAFLDKLINVTLPQIRDFRGISSDKFDKNGNFNLGLTEQLVFPEINYDDVDQTRGFNISIITSAKTKNEGKALLEAFNFPFND